MNEPISIREVVIERAQGFRQLSQRFQAEAMGLIWAIDSADPIPYSTDQQTQDAFLCGHREGRRLLEHSGKSGGKPA